MCQSALENDQKSAVITIIVTWMCVMCIFAKKKRKRKINCVLYMSVLAFSASRLKYNGQFIVPL